MNSELLNLVITSIQRVEGNQAIATTRPRENDVAGLSVQIKEKANDTISNNWVATWQIQYGAYKAILRDMH